MGETYVQPGGAVIVPDKGTTNPDPVVTGDGSTIDLSAYATDIELNTEVTRAQAVEALMAHLTDVDDETVRAQAQEALAAHITDLNAEISRAQAAEALKATTAGLSSETSRAQAAEALMQTTASFNAWAALRPIVNAPGTLANRPPNGSQPDGSEYYATDDNGGQRYVMTAGAWQKRGPAVGDASGASLGYGEVAVTAALGNWAVGNTDVDLAGTQFGFVSGVRAFQVEGDFSAQLGLGAAASGISTRVTCKLWLSTDGGTNWTMLDGKSGPSKIITGESYLHNIKCRSALIVPPANGTAYNVKGTIAASNTGVAVTIFGRNNSVTSSVQVFSR